MLPHLKKEEVSAERVEKSDLIELFSRYFGQYRFSDLFHEIGKGFDFMFF